MVKKERRVGDGGTMQRADKNFDILPETPVFSPSALTSMTPGWFPALPPEPVRIITSIGKREERR